MKNLIKAGFFGGTMGALEACSVVYNGEIFTGPARIAFHSLLGTGTSFLAENKPAAVGVIHALYHLITLNGFYNASYYGVQAAMIAKLIETTASLFSSDHQKQNHTNASTFQPK